MLSAGLKGTVKGLGRWIVKFLNNVANGNTTCPGSRERRDHTMVVVVVSRWQEGTRLSIDPI